MGNDPRLRREADAPDTPATSGAGLTPAQLEAVKRRDPEALGALFDHFIDRVHGLAMRLLRDRADAEDVTQELFLRVHRSCHQLDVTRDPGPWLMTIATNLCRERWRRAKRRGADRTYSIDDKPETAELAAPGQDPAAGAVAAQRREHLEAAIGALPEAMRAVVVLHNREGLTHEEIAAAMNETPAAVRKRYSRALAQLRKTLQEVQE